MSDDVSKFLDKEGRIIAWPKREEDKVCVVKYLASLFECDKIYTEKEVNQIIISHHLFMQHTMLRRELIIKGYMDRKPDGSMYWKIQQG